MDYLFDEVVGKAQSLGSVHHFVWDRTRAIRNDFSIQQLSKTSDLRIAIECYEKIARFHILSLHQLALKKKPYDKYDWYQEREQLDRTLLSLMQYYDDSREQLQSPNEAEFRAYCVIFQIQSPIPDMEDRVQTWPQHIILNMRVQKSLELYAAACNVADAQGPLKPRAPQAVAQANWEKFWALIRSNQVSYLMSCVAEIYFNLVRRTALMAIWKASRQVGKMKVDGWTISKLTNVLGFDKVRQVEDFCALYGFSFDRRDDGKRFLDVSSVRGKTFPAPSSGMKEQVRSETIVEAKRHGRTLPAVIKGLSVAAAQAAGLVEKNSHVNEVRQFKADGSSVRKEHARKAFAMKGNINEDADDGDSLFVGQSLSGEKSSSDVTNPLLNGVKPTPARETPPLQNVAGIADTSKNHINGSTNPTNFLSPFKNAPSSLTGTTSFGKPSAPAANKDALPSNSQFSSPFVNNKSKPNENFQTLNNSRLSSGLFDFNAGTSSKPASMPSFSLETASPAASHNASGIGQRVESAPPIFNFQNTQSPKEAFVFGSPDSKVKETHTDNSLPGPQGQKNEPNVLFSKAAHASAGLGTGFIPSKSVLTDIKSNETFSFSKPAETPSFQNLAQPSVSDIPASKTNDESKPITSESATHMQQNQQISTGDNNLDPNKPSLEPGHHDNITSAISIINIERKAFDNLAKHMVLNAETGFLTQFIEYTIGPVISEGIKQVAQERLQREAMQFRRNWLAARYGRAWKEVAWHIKLAREGRKRRARIARKREERARLAESKVERDVRDFEDLVGSTYRLGETNSLGSGLQDVGMRREKGREREATSEENAKRRISRGDTSNCGKQDWGSASNWQRSHSNEESKWHQHQYQLDQRSEQSSFDTSTPAPASTFTASILHGPERRSTTKTNYFRLKALGIQPIGQNSWDRPPTAPTIKSPTSTTSTPLKSTTRTSPPSTLPSQPSQPPQSRQTRPSSQHQQHQFSSLASSSLSNSLPTQSSPPLPFLSSSHQQYQQHHINQPDTIAEAGRNALKQNQTQTLQGATPAGTAITKATATTRPGVGNDVPGTRGVKRRKSYASDAEQQDEALFARLRAAKEALQESISFFREEMALCDGGDNVGSGGRVHDRGSRLWDRRQ